MLTKHLTDDEVQQFVVGELNYEKEIAQHIHWCEKCKAKVEVYRLLITGISQQPPPVFDFDVSATVLKQFATQSPGTTNDKLLTWVFIFICVGLTGTVFYFFRGFLYSLFKGITSISIYLMVISAITVIAILLVEMYKKYQKEMKILDLY